MLVPARQGDGADGEPHCHLVALPPAALTVRSVSFRIEVRIRVPRPFVRGATMVVAGSHLRGSSPRFSRVRTSYIEGARVRQPSCLIAETSSFACSPRGEFAFSIRTQMIVHQSPGVVARMGGVGSPYWGTCWETLPAPESLRWGMHAGAGSPRLYASGNSGFLPVRSSTRPDLVTAFPPERRYVPSGGPPSRGPLEALRVADTVRPMRGLLESVPNFSEGRDAATLDAIRRALAAHARVLDVHADADHNRSVFTCIGPAGRARRGPGGGDRGRRRADRPAPHEGVHPRVGAADVVPVRPVPGRRSRARARGPPARGARRRAGHPGASATATSAAAAGRRSSGRAASDALAARLDVRRGRAALRARPSCTRPRARSSSACARRSSRSTSSSTRETSTWPARSPRRCGRATAAFRACRRSAFGSRAPAARRSR